MGNLGDISQRALDVLRAVRCIAAEDTRRTRILLNHFDIVTELVRYDDHTHRRAAPRLLECLDRGEDVAQVTDAGMPGISDPGTALVNAARAAGIPIEVVPGPDAITTALVASGFPSVPFTFHGFAPRKAGERKRLLAGLPAGTHIFYESPERLPAFARAVAAHQPDAEVAICRELTKKHEEVLRGAAGEIAVDVAEGVRGEVVLLLSVPGPVAVEVSDTTLRDAVAELTGEGVEKKAAVKAVAERYDVPKRRVYSLTIERD